VQLLSIVTYGEFRELTEQRLPPSSRGKALLLVLLVAGFFALYFAWLYYREWQMKKNFRRYWQRKSPKVDEANVEE
jgi:hypothetical protein